MAKANTVGPKDRRSMSMLIFAQRLHESRYRSAIFAVFGAIISFAGELGFQPLTQVQPWVKQFAALAMLGFGLIAIIGFVAGSFLKLREP